jgi:hypothetical protein
MMPWPAWPSAGARADASFTPAAHQTKRDTKNGTSEIDDRNVTSFDLRVMQICLGDESRDRTAFALMRSSGIAIFCTILSEKYND